MVLLPTVVHGTHVVGPIMFGGGVKRLRRFSGVSQAFLPVFGPNFSNSEGCQTPLKRPTCGPTAVERRTVRICVGPDRGRGRAGAWV